LRERVLAGRPDGWQLGYPVLASKGMVAWIGAQTTLAPAAAAGTSAPDSTAPTTLSLSTPTSTPSTDPSTALSSLPCAGQLVAVLAQMALAHA
jgi:hypothetical protein